MAELLTVAVEGKADESKAAEAARRSLTALVREAGRGHPGLKKLALLRAEYAAAVGAAEIAAKRVGAAEEKLARLDREPVPGHLAAIQAAKAERAAAEADRVEAEEAATRLKDMARACHREVYEAIHAAAVAAVRTLGSELDMRIGGCRERILIAVGKAIAATAVEANDWATAEETRRQIERQRQEIEFAIRGELIGQSALPYEPAPAVENLIKMQQMP